LIIPALEASLLTEYQLASRDGAMSWFSQLDFRPPMAILQLLEAMQSLCRRLVKLSLVPCLSCHALLRLVDLRFQRQSDLETP
jgi:hypothetical protein